MKTIHNLIGGLAGAIALNILHQTAAQFDKDAPRVDLIGEEALNKGLVSAGASPLKGTALFASTMAGDLVSNTLYYSLIGVGNKKQLLPRGALYGALAGIGALTLTEPLGLNDAPVTKTYKTGLLTVCWYTFGGIVAALTIRSVQR